MSTASASWSLVMQPSRRRRRRGWRSRFSAASSSAKSAPAREFVGDAAGGVLVSTTMPLTHDRAARLDPGVVQRRGFVGTRRPAESSASASLVLDPRGDLGAHRLGGQQLIAGGTELGELRLEVVAGQCGVADAGDVAAVGEGGAAGGECSDRGDGQHERETSIHPPNATAPGRLLSGRTEGPPGDGAGRTVRSSAGTRSRRKPARNVLASVPRGSGTTSWPRSSLYFAPFESRRRRIVSDSLSSSGASFAVPPVDADPRSGCR